MAEPQAGLIVCYDGECAVCRTAVARLRRLDPDGALRMVPFQDVTAAGGADRAGGAPAFNGIDRAQLTSALHVIEPDGTWTSGGAAVLRIADALPRLRLVARLGRLPVVNHLVEPVYKLVTRHRHRLSRLLGSAGSGGE